MENIVQFVIYLDFSKDLFIVKGEQRVLAEPFRGILHQIYRLLTMALFENNDYLQIAIYIILLKKTLYKGFVFLNILIR